MAPGKRPPLHGKHNHRLSAGSEPHGHKHEPSHSRKEPQQKPAAAQKDTLPKSSVPGYLIAIVIIIIIIALMYFFNIKI